MPARRSCTKCCCCSGGGVGAWLSQQGEAVLNAVVAVGEVLGRGCASKEKLYYVQCENHEMDGIVEKFCYCSFNLCNTAASQVPLLYLSTVYYSPP